jgi:ribosomal small subunit protein bTHX
MGKGDQKTRRGKIQVGSFGKVRPRKKATAVTAEQIAAGLAAKKAAPKKASAKKAAK